MFVASDLAALVRHTSRVVHLDDGEFASVTATGYRTFTIDGSDTGARPHPAHHPTAAAGLPRGVDLGRDIDRPRNLAKSVTVE